jgi:hypothetical protein
VHYFQPLGDFVKDISVVGRASDTTPVAIFQLKNPDENSIFVEMLKTIKNYKLQDLDNQLSKQQELLSNYLPGVKRFPCVFDEAQYLLKLGVGKFLSNDGFSK